MFSFADTAPSVLLFGLVSGIIAAVFLWALLTYERVKQLGLREVQALVERKRQVVREKMEIAPTDLNQAFMQEVRAAAGSDAAMPEALKSLLAGAMASRADRAKDEGEKSAAKRESMRDRARKGKMKKAAGR